jgi:hypothetical protein
MSPKSRGRPAGRGRSSKPRRPAPATHEDLLRATAAALQAVESALVAEELASMLVATWSSGAPNDPGKPTERAAAAVATLEEMGAIRTLLAIRAVTESDLRDLIDGAVRRLVTERARVLPDWADRLGRVELVECLRVTEILADQDLWVLRFHYSGDDRPISHVLSASIDRNRGGIVRDITVADPNTADALFALWRSAPDNDPGLSVAVGDPAEAATALATAVARTDITIDADLTQSAFGLLPLLRTRLRALPPIDLSRQDLAWRQTDAEDLETLAAEFAAWFTASPRSADLPAGVDPEKLARGFLESTSFGDDLLRWSPIRVETVLLDWLPRKVVISQPEMEAVPDTLREFVRWALERRHIPERAIEATVAAVARWEHDFAAAMADEQQFGLAKRQLLDMQHDGVDIDDTDAVARWIDAHQDNADAPAPGAS